MTGPEFSRLVDLRQITGQPLVLEPDEAERRRLAARFGISAIRSMRAEVLLIADGAKVDARGRLVASILQPCAISGEDFPVSIDEPVHLRFVPPAGDHAPDEEVEITAEDCDEIEYEGTAFDLGEAVAQSLALAIDPFAEGPDADRARAEHNLSGDSASGPFAALAALRKD
ncbi:MAG: YceD family protein [Novosphingobium sp.]